MEIRDLGELDGPVLVFGGILSNLQALQAMLAEARRLSIPPERIICTGDVVAYCADPEACVELVRETGITVLAGNCEKQLAEDAADCGCGFGEGTECSLLAIGWYVYARTHVSQASREWMGTCPDRIVFRQNGRRFAVVHGGATSINRFLFEVTPREAFDEEIVSLIDQVRPVDAVLAGHSGIAFSRRLNGVDWINAGALGLPQHDGDPRTAYVTLRQGQPEFHRLVYDHKSAAAAMRKARLKQGYHLTLETGYWPSEDVLPPELRRV